MRAGHEAAARDRCDEEVVAVRLSHELPPVVLAPLGLGWGQRTKSAAEELYPMPSWQNRARSRSAAEVLSRSMARQEQLRIPYRCSCSCRVPLQRLTSC